MQQNVALKDDLKSETLSTIRGFVARIKAHTGYTEAIGHDLGVIGSASIASVASNKTVLKAEVLPGRVRLSFVKEEFFRREHLCQANRNVPVAIPCPRQ